MFFGQFIHCRNAFSVCVYALTILTGLSISAGSVHARARSDAMLIIDSSISMSGKIGKNSKITLVRKGLKPALKSARPRLNLGVIFYGHRRRGDCKDVQHVIRLGDIRQKRYMEIINSIDPKGRAPTAAAITLAAKILKKREQSNSVILITDGFDICKGQDTGKNKNQKKAKKKDNLCALGKKLRQTNSGLKVHVIALRSKTSKMASLRCLATRTGGSYTAVNTPAAISKAIEDTFKLASTGNIPIPRINPRRQKQMMVTAAATTEKDSRSDMSALSVEQQKTTGIEPQEIPSREVKTAALDKVVSPQPVPIAREPATTTEKLPPSVPSATTEPEDKTTASIFKSFFGSDKKGQEIAKTPSETVTTATVVEKPQKVPKTPDIQNNNVKEKTPGTKQKPVKIPADPTPVQTPGLSLSARMGTAGPVIGNDLFWRIFTVATDTRKAKEIRQTGAAKPLLDLKPGTYTIVVQYGTVIQSQTVRVTANRITTAIIPIEAGIIETRAFRVANGKPLDKDVSYILLAADSSNGDNGSEISRKTASRTHFFVKPGRYRLIGKFGSGTLSENVRVRAGKTTVVNFIFNTGTLKVSTVAAKGGGIIKGATYIISRAQTDAQGQRKEIARSSKNRTTFTLPAGFYHLKVQQGAASLERTIKIEANKTKIMVLNLNAGYLKLFASPAPGAPVLQDNVHYTIYKGEDSLDDENEKITQSTKSAPRFWLPAGEYLATATYGLASASIPVTIKAGRRTEKTIIIRAGALRLSSKVEGMPEKIKKQVFYMIYDAKPDLEGNYREIFSTSQAEKTVRLPPGEYLIEGRWGNTNVRTPVSAAVMAGKRTSAVVIHRAGRARFRLVSVPGGAPTGKPYWTFYDAAGVEIGRNVKPTPERIFAAGKYAVVVRYDDQQFKAEFSIKTGDQKRIDIVAKQ